MARLALALSAAALVVALLGSTSAGQALVSNVPRSSVGQQHLGRNAVGPQKLAPNAVHTGHVLNGSLLADDFKAGGGPALLASNPAGATQWLALAYEVDPTGGAWRLSPLVVCARGS